MPAKGGGALPALCNVLGALMLVVAVGLFATLMVPPLLGYQLFDMANGSMEPELPVGSAVYVKYADPIDVQEDEVIAYHADESVVMHRVVINNASSGEFVTKGDANTAEDPAPVQYEAVVGRVEAHVPMVGAFIGVFESIAGKVYLLLVAACGVMLNMVASRMRTSRRKKTLGQGQAAAYAGQYPRHSAQRSSDYARPTSRIGSIVRGVLMAVLAVAFVGSAGVIAYVNWQYHESDSLYGEAIDKYLDPVGADGKGIDVGSSDDDTKPPITIDFEALCAANPDVVGWIYCPGTVINYPVLQGKDNDQYLDHDYTGGYNIDGSIFVDCDNARGFADSNTIVYGHHMNSGSMFATLENWADQAYYEKHPIMWLLTPTQDYKIMLFSSHHVNAYSTMYQIIHEPGEELAALLGEALVESSLHAKAQLDSTLNKLATMKGIELDKIQVNEDAPFVLVDADSRYVMLSTCAYLFDDDRYVLHGKLVPVKTAGGKAK